MHIYRKYDRGYGMLTISIYKKAIQRVAEIIDTVDEKRVLQGKSFLITGASGLIGTVMVDALMLLSEQKKYEITVYAVGRNEAKMRERFTRYIERENFHIILHDVNQPFLEINRVDYLIHAASNTHPVAYSTDPVGTITTNVIGTNHLLKYAVEHQVERVVFLSSVEIYGEATEGMDEFYEGDCGYIDCNTVRAGYPESKRVGESLCQAYLEKYGLDVVIPRLCRVYGPTMREEDSKALAQFIHKVVAGENIVLKSDGTQYYSYIHVMDAVTAIFVVLLKGDKGRAYNVASEKSNITLRELAEKLAKSANVSVQMEIPDAIESKGYSKATRAILNNEKLKKLGWNEQYCIDDGIEMTVQILSAIERMEAKHDTVRA